MKNRATKFISLALCAVVLFAAVGTSVFALTGEGKESEDENQETTINASAEAETAFALVLEDTGGSALIRVGKALDSESSANGEPIFSLEVKAVTYGE